MVNKFISIITRLFNHEKRGQDPYELRIQYQKDMDSCTGIVRNKENIQEMIEITSIRINEFCEMTKVENNMQLHQALINRDILISQLVYLHSIIGYIDFGGSSRGSYLIAGNENNDNDKIKDFDEYIQIIKPDIENLSTDITYIKRKDIPKAYGWFEKVYNKYMNKE